MEENVLSFQIVLDAESSDVGDVVLREALEFLQQCDADGDFDRLDWPAARGLPKTIHYMVKEQGADPSRRDEGGRTAMHVAAKAGHVDCVQALIEVGGDVMAKDTFGVTPLHLAAGEGKEDMVSFLLEQGCPPDCICGKGSTPLLNACGAAHVRVARCLLMAGANPNRADMTGIY